MKRIYYFLGVFSLLIVASCDLDKDLQDPNEVAVESADPTLIMNSVQLDFADFYNSASNLVDQLVRMQTMTGGYRYETAIQPQNVDATWRLAYQRVLTNTKILIPLAESKGLTTHVGVAKILEAYVYLTLVDLFNDVPRSEALLGLEGNYNPNVDAGESVYNHAIDLLEQARTELQKEGVAAGAALSRDIFYGGNRSRWTALANTLELKAWVNISMISSRSTEANTRIDELLTQNIIDTEAENFTYKYGAVTVPSGSRHPLYDQFYGASSGTAAGYIGNYFMYELFAGKGVQDPRWRYYFYRQVGSISEATRVDPKSIGCSKGAVPPTYEDFANFFCTFDPGFYGRDHGDATGTPPDSPVITCAGVYPAGGRADTNPTSNRTYRGATVRGDGANGAGIQPIWMSFFTDYLKAEIQARRGENALPQLTTAIQNSITQVRNFANSKGQSLPAGLEPLTSPYVAAVTTLYDNAATKTDIVGREFYVACWGNGIEAYNIYRRTGAPTNMPPPIQANPGPFYRSMIYPAVFVNLNSSVQQRDVSSKVFWDTNPNELN
jgi:hypothetical protein